MNPSDEGGQMTHAHRRLIPENLQNRFFRVLAPLIKLFTKWELNPNSFTVAGVIITSVAAAAFLMGFIRLGGILILLGGLCDTIDGQLARNTGRATRFGALLDSTVDRYSEFIMFFSIAAYFIYIEDFGASAATFLALCGSFMVSYARARAESLGFNAKIGIMQRPERIVLIGLGALVHIVAFELAIWLIAILANFTALQRIRFAYKQESAEFKEEAIIKT
jgi:CDP-diacylglycerol--glycerol-3-phosphate 3-phosphatidyltransferase